MKRSKRFVEAEDEESVVHKKKAIEKKMYAVCRTKSMLKEDA